MLGIMQVESERRPSMRTMLTIGAVALPRPRKSLLARLLSMIELTRASYKTLPTLMPMQSVYAALPHIFSHRGISLGICTSLLTMPRARRQSNSLSEALVLLRKSARGRGDCEIFCR